MQFRVNELYSNANGRVQFIELIGEADNQQALANFSLTVTRSAVQINTFLFSGGLPSTQTAGRTVLLATQDFANLGLVTPDFIIPNSFLFLDGATLTFPANGLNGPYDILPYLSLPTDGATSVDRLGGTAISSPRNFAGVTGAITGNPIPGTANADNLVGTAGNDFIGGGAGNDTLNGGAGDDTLHGSTGTDTASYAGAAAVAVSLAVAGAQNTGGAGADTLVLIENLTGSGGNDALTGDAANNVLDGGPGNDTMAGGPGNDIYVRDAAGDVMVELAGQGGDLVESSVSCTLVANLEMLTLTGAGHVNGTGNGVNNVLTGNTGNNVLNGGNGNDTMIGGTGNDTYVRNAAGDVVIESPGQGADTVQSAVSYMLGANLENLTLTGANDINGTGNGVNNVLTGNAGNNVLNGGNGNDTMIGGGGNDTYVANSGADVVSELAGQGADTVQSAVTWILKANLENLTLTGSGNVNGTGNGVNNVLTGNTGGNVLNAGNGNDALDGGAGVDTLRGMDGNDTLAWDPDDTLIDGGAGSDTLKVNGGNLNLTTTANDKVLNVETINMTGGGNNVLTLNTQDVLDFSTTTNTLKVLGDAGDSINIVGAFTDLGVSGSFHRYDFGGAVLLVHTDITSVA